MTDQNTPPTSGNGSQQPIRPQQPGQPQSGQTAPQQSPQQQAGQQSGQAATQQPVYTQYPQQYQQPYQQGYTQQNNQYRQPAYAQPVYSQPAASNLSEDAELTTGNWMLTLLLTFIPIVNIVMLFIWGFGDSAPFAKKNWARAQLIWTAIMVGIYIIIFVIFIAVGVSLSSNPYGGLY